MKEQIEKNTNDISFIRDQLQRVIRYLLKKNPKDFEKNGPDEI
tara:strand:- start:159 stop:287 length:129 start_codon:yes stop_codon:yes gene_type:complete